MPQATFSINAAELVDEAGVHWQRRGGPRDALPEKRLLRLMADPNVRVVNIDGFEQQDLPPQERERFWTEARRREATEERVTYWAVEFKNAAGGRLVLIDHSC